MRRQSVSDIHVIIWSPVQFSLNSLVFWEKRSSQRRRCCDNVQKKSLIPAVNRLRRKRTNSERGQRPIIISVAANRSINRPASGIQLDTFGRRSFIALRLAAHIPSRRPIYIRLPSWIDSSRTTLRRVIYALGIASYRDGAGSRVRLQFLNAAKLYGSRARHRPRTFKIFRRRMARERAK